MPSISIQILRSTGLQNSLRKVTTGSGHELPSPYVIVSLDNEPLFRTDTVRHNQNPVWNQSFTIDLPSSGSPAEKLVFDVIDNITMFPDVSLGQLSLPISKVREYCSKSSSTSPTKISEKLASGDSILEVSFRLQDQDLTKSLSMDLDGRRRALLVGINYVSLEKGKGQLSGCWNDVKNMRKLLTTRFGFQADEIRELMDEPSLPADRQPTRDNLLRNFEWLVENALPGDHFVFHFSGHGSQVRDTSGDEADGKDETLIPCDFKKSGMIIDDKINEILVQRTPDGCRLFSIMDCCHSGTGMDLPFEYKETGLDRNLILSRGNNKVGAVNLGFVERKTRSNTQKLGDVVLISGCKDDQTSADATLEGASSGAMTYALVKVLENHPTNNVTYGQLLREMREILRQKKLTQIPQLSSSKSFDFNTTTLHI